MSTQILFNVPWISGKESDYLSGVLASNSFAGNGPYTKACQALLEERFGVHHVLLTSSCTAALELSAMALEVGCGDEVIVPSYTFASTASAFLRSGATIVFADVDERTLMLDVDDVARKITPRTRVIVPVHYGGWAANLDDLLSLSADNQIVVVEDAAQGLGSKIGEKWLGTHGTFGCISFHETKNIHCGLGGALFINDSSLFDRTENMWERGTNRAKLFKGLVDKYSWVEPGSSFYPCELQAAFLLAQLESLDENLEIRAKLTERYFSRLNEFQDAGRLWIQRRMLQSRWNHHAVIVVLKSEEAANRVRVSLRDQGVHAYIGYVPLHSSPMGRRLGWSPEDLPVTESIAPCVLRLPLHHQMTLEDVDLVCDLVSFSI